MRDVTTTELADAPRCFGTGLARAPVIEPSWTPMMQGSAWLQDVKPRGATGPRFRFEAHLRHRDPAELRGPQPQQQDGLTRFRCTIQAPPRGCFVRSTFLRGSEHRRPPMPWGSGPGQDAAMRRPAWASPSIDLQGGGTQGTSMTVAPSPRIRSPPHHPCSRVERVRAMPVPVVGQGGANDVRIRSMEMRSKLIGDRWPQHDPPRWHPLQLLECVPPSTTVQPGPSDRVLMSDPPVMREGPPAMTGPPMRRRAQPNQAEVAWEEVSDYGHGDRTR